MLRREKGTPNTMLPSPTPSDQPIARLPFYRQLYVQVLIAIAAGVAIGHFFPETGVALQPLGEAFIKLVKMIIAPVIFLTIVTGVAGMKEIGSGSCRERVCQIVYIWVVAGALKKKQKKQTGRED